MSNVLDTNSVLFMNGSWLPIRVGNPRQAILAMNSEGESSACVALDIVYGVNKDGSWDFNNPPISIMPVKWENWITLDVRDYDEVIHSAKLTIRSPKVCIAQNYHKMPQMRFRPSKRVIYEREKGMCAYSGKKLSLKESSLDHKFPKSRGGKDTFQNLVLCETRLNSWKGDRTLEECGLKLLIEPKEPMPVPMSTKITESKFLDWGWFIMKNQK